MTASAWGLLLGALGAVGWHAEPTGSPFGAIFVDSSNPPSRQQLAAWVDMWRPWWWPVVLGFPAIAFLAATAVGLSTAPLLSRRHSHSSRAARVARPTLTFGFLGLVLGGLGAVGWHHHPFILREPPPLIFTSLTPAQRERVLERIQAGPAAGRVDDWADLWWPAALAYPLLATLLGLGAGLTLVQRQAPADPVDRATPESDVRDDDPTSGPRAGG